MADPSKPPTPKVPLRITLRRLYSLAWPERWPLALATVFLLGSAAGNLAFPRAAGTPSTRPCCAPRRGRWTWPGWTGWRWC